MMTVNTVKQHRKLSLESRFTFAEDSLARVSGAWDSDLRSATGLDDGERYLLRLFRKTGTPLDDDLKAIITRGLRRIRRVLSSRRAREVLVEVLDVVEDGQEIAIIMVDPGSPISGSSHRRRARQDRFLASTSRTVFWRNIVRIAEALTLCHDAGIVHGGVSTHTIFSHSDDSDDYRLGGFEACVHIADSNLGASAHLLRASGAISFRQPQLHAKFLAWDNDHIVVSSLNWGSQSGLEDNPLDEIGLYLEGSNLATSLLKQFEAANR